MDLLDERNSVFCDHSSKSLNLALLCVHRLIGGLDECNLTSTCVSGLVGGLAR